MQKQPSYSQTLGTAFQLLVHNPLLFLPLSILFLLNVAVTLFQLKVQQSLWFILPLVGAAMISLLVQGWQFDLIKQLFETKKVSNNAARSLKMAWRLIKVMLLFLLLTVLILIAIMLVILVVIGISALLMKLSKILGVIVAVILGLTTFVAVVGFFFLYICYFYQFYPYVILQEVRSWETITTAYRNFRKNMGFYCKRGILTLLLSLVAEMPFFIYSIAIAVQQKSASLLSQIVGQLFLIPMMILSVMVMISYCFWYRK